MKRLWTYLVAMLLSLGCVAQERDSIQIPDDAQRYDYFFLEAMVQRQKGNNDAAFDLLRHCIEINPQASEAYYYLAQYYAALKDGDKALEYVKKAADLCPDNAIYMETLAQRYIGAQKFDLATAVIERLYDQNKDREDLLEMLFQLYQHEKDYQKAISVLERMESIDGKSERLAYAKSEIYTQMGDKKAAMAEIEALSRQYPNDLNYLCMYADMLLMNDQKKQALDIYQQVLSEEPENNRGLVSLLAYYRAEHDAVMVDSLTETILKNRNTSTEQKAFLLRQVIAENEDQGGDSTQVLSLFQRLLDVPQPDADLASLYVAYMDLKHMPKDSIRPVLEQVLDIAPDNAAARLQLVSYAWDAKDTNRVIELCQAARQYNPDEMAFYYYQGMAYYQQDRRDEALETFRNGVDVIDEDSNPAIVSDFYAIMGDLLHQKGMEREAFEAYDSCLVWKDDNIMCLNNYAYYLSILGQQLERAEQMSYRTIKAEPKNSTYLDTYAWILFMQKRYAEAKVYIDQAMQNLEMVSVGGDSLSNATIFEHAGDIYWFCQEPDSSLLFWQDALKGDGDNKVLIRKVKLKKYIKE